MAVFGAIASCPNAAKFPHAARWWNHIAGFSAAARAAFPGSVTVAVAAPAAAAAAAGAGAGSAAAADDAEAEDVDFDAMFGDDDDDAAPAASKKSVRARERGAVESGVSPLAVLCRRPTRRPRTAA